MTDQRTVADIRRDLVKAADAYHEAARAHSDAKREDGPALEAWCAWMTAANLANVIAAMLRRAGRDFGEDCAVQLAEIVTSAEDKHGDSGESAYFANDDVRGAA